MRKLLLLGLAGLLFGTDGRSPAGLHDRAGVVGRMAVESGGVDAIQQFRFGQATSGLEGYLRYGAYAIAIALGVIAALALWNRTLRRAIQQRNAALGESELHLRQVTENIRDVFWIATPALDTLLYVSPAYESIWGRPATAALGSPPRVESIHPEDRERVVAQIRASRQEGFDLEYRIVRPDGSVRWIHNRAFPVHDGSGPAYRLAGIARDLSEQKSAESAAGEIAVQLELLTRRLVLLQELERNALARELHDRVGQNLTALNINLSILRSALPPEASDALRARLDDSETLLEATSAAIRGVVAELRPPMLDDQGLALALDWYAGEVSARTGVLVQVQDLAEGRPPPQVEIALFRIAQEALNNVVKHAWATRVEIALSREGADYRMTIEDDGVGFDATARAARGAGLGMVTMRERSQSVGGSFEVRALRGSGTLLSVRVPVA